MQGGVLATIVADPASGNTACRCCASAKGAGPGESTRERLAQPMAPAAARAFARKRRILSCFTHHPPCHRLRSCLFSECVAELPGFSRAAHLARSAIAATTDGDGLRHGVFTRTRAAPALWPCLPSDARHAASTRSPSLRPMTLPPCHEPGRPRSALRRSIICLSLTSHLLRVSGAASTRRSISCLSRGALPGPAQPRALLPSHRPPPNSPAAPRLSLRLRSRPRPFRPRSLRSRG